MLFIKTLGIFLYQVLKSLWVNILMPLGATCLIFLVTMTLITLIGWCFKSLWLILGLELFPFNTLEIVPIEFSYGVIITFGILFSSMVIYVVYLLLHLIFKLTSKSWQVARRKAKNGNNK